MLNKNEVNSIPALSLDLRGFDKDNNKTWFSVELLMGLEELNKYPEKPVNITEYLSDCEAFIKKPNMDHARELDLWYATNDIEDMYHNLTSIWVFKKE